MMCSQHASIAGMVVVRSYQLVQEQRPGKAQRVGDQLHNTERIVPPAKHPAIHHISSFLSAIRMNDWYVSPVKGPQHDMGALVCRVQQLIALCSVSEHRYRDEMAPCTRPWWLPRQWRRPPSRCACRQTAASSAGLYSAECAAATRHSAAKRQGIHDALIATHQIAVDHERGHPRVAQRGEPA